MAGPAKTAMTPITEISVTALNTALSAALKRDVHWMPTLSGGWRAALVLLLGGVIEPTIHAYVTGGDYMTSLVSCGVSIIPALVQLGLDAITALVPPTI